MSDNTVDLIIEWIATSALLISVALTAYDIYPANTICGFIANGLWIIVSFRWRKWSLFTTSVIICAIYAAGLINYIL